ncbi:MAG: LuxR C-terminal-related transcriptional regulator, partial [Thermomicrobiales bacterium]
ALVLKTTAQTLDVEEDRDLPLDAIAKRLGDQPWLLILDNFEHLAPAATDVSDLLSRCSMLDILVTSRTRLQLQGEHEFTVPPLAVEIPVPLPDHTSPIGPAVELFLQRAGAVTHDLTSPAASGTTIASICARLDGLPLAIELAAARSKVLPPDAMLQRLDRRLSLLTGGSRDAPDRHRTMRDAIDWSYALLPPPAQMFFRRLCVFPGAFTLLEAESVGQRPTSSTAREPIDSAIDQLALLIDSSLLRRQVVEGEPTFVTLETIREFGWEQLQELGELDGVRSDHANYVIALAEAALPHLRGADRWLWLDRLERAHDNLRAALSWLCERGDARRAAQLAGALWRFWWWRSHLAEGRRTLDLVLQLPGVSEPEEFYARVLTGHGALSETQGDVGVADRSYDKAIEVWRATGNTHELALSFLFRWLVALDANSEERMHELASESLRLFRELDDPWGIGMALLEQGVAAMVREDYPGAEHLLLQSTDMLEAIDDPWGLALAQGVLGNIKSGQGDYIAARQLLRESLSSLLRMDDQWGVATVLLSVARTAASQSQYEQLARISGAIQNLHTTLGAAVRTPFRDRYERNLAAAAEHLGCELFDALLAEGASMTPSEAVAAALEPISTKGDRQPSPKHHASLTYESLSRREREVLRLVPGRTAKEIGHELFISESTVRTHIEHILNKFGLRTQKELIAYVSEHHLL